ncbi:hypothetical protein [Facklamia sp. P12934]|uniref:hypothetical protein n=1 Tax=unclassified Facklamia TaxID=2622293 RepID=UPI003D1732EC
MISGIDGIMNLATASGEDLALTSDIVTDTIDDTALAIGLMANAGIKSSQAGTALRRIMVELQGDLTLTSLIRKLKTS